MHRNTPEEQQKVTHPAPNARKSRTYLASRGIETGEQS